MDELAKHFAELADKYGPKVADAALEAARVEAFSCLMGSLIWFGLALAACLLGRFLYRKSHEENWDNDWVFLAFVSWAVAGGLCVPGVWAWIDPWTWITISHPELWLAKQAFHI